MHLSLRAKFAAVVVIAAFLAQPVLGAAVCWQMGAAAGSCATPCPMGDEAPPATAKAEANDPGCCEISATEPGSLTSLVANLGAVRLAVPAPVTLAGLTAPPASVAVTPPEVPLHSTGPSLFLLCVLLI